MHSIPGGHGTAGQLAWPVTGLSAKAAGPALQQCSAHLQYYRSLLVCRTALRNITAGTKIQHAHKLCLAGCVLSAQAIQASAIETLVLAVAGVLLPCCLQQTRAPGSHFRLPPPLVVLLLVLLLQVIEGTGRAINTVSTPAQSVAPLDCLYSFVQLLLLWPLFFLVIAGLGCAAAAAATAV